MTGMKIERLAELLDTFGANSLSWPEPERMKAQLLIEQSDDAKRLLASAQRLGEVLDQWQAPLAGDSLKSAILADAHSAVSEHAEAQSKLRSASIAKDQESARSFLQELADAFADLIAPWGRQVAAILTVALVIGVWAGTFVSSPSIDQEQLIAAYGSDVNDWMSELDPAVAVLSGGET